MSQPTAEELSGIPLFASLDDLARGHILTRLEVAEYSDGERIVVEGTSGEDLFVIRKGRAVATQKERGMIRLLGPDDFFGEIALLGKGERTATITASTPMEVWILRSDAIRALDNSNPAVLEALTTAMQDRLASG
jgi:CRP-like cAMP-binding protein